MIQIRKEQREDIDAIRFVNEKAFDRPQEANIIDRLRQSCSSLLSLVAVLEGRVIGHILFSPAAIESNGHVTQGMGLAPLAVLPEHQRQGVSSQLVQEGLNVIGKSSNPFVIVVGYPGYYCRFGFEPASKYGIRSQWENIPDEAFMILILDKSIAHGLSGLA